MPEATARIAVLPETIIRIRNYLPNLQPHITHDQFINKFLDFVIYNQIPPETILENKRIIWIKNEFTDKSKFELVM